MSKIICATAVNTSRDNIIKFTQFESTLQETENTERKSDTTMDSWSNKLEDRLLELYAREDVVDIFWGQPVEEHLAGSTLWYIYVVTRGWLYSSNTKKEVLDNGQVIYFIEEEDGFANFDDDTSLNLPKIPQDLQEKFEEVLDNDLGPSFRELHYNLVGISTGYKRIGGKLTEIPAIILYVRQKGILRRGCGGLFKKMICGFPTDIVEACIARPCCYQNYLIGQEDCQSYQKDITLGSSIGIGIHEELEKEPTGKKSLGTGTLGIVVREKKSPNRIGFVSCEHVVKCDKPNSIIYQPSLEELLDGPNRRINQLENEGRDDDKLKIEYLKINLVKEKDPTLAIYKFGVYEFGMRKNHFFKQHNKSYGIDAAFCVFNNENRMLYTRNFPIDSMGFKSVQLFDDFCLTGFYTLDELNSFDDSNKVFKIGRTTGLAVGKWTPGYTSVAIDLSTKSIKNANKTGEQVPPHNEESQGIFIGYMKSQLNIDIIEGRKKCFPTMWFDRQLAFEFKAKEFDLGDSGSSVIDKKGKAFGILHAKFETNYFSYGIASPYFAVFEALNIEICLSPDPIKPTIIATGVDSSQ